MLSELYSQKVNEVGSLDFVAMALLQLAASPLKWVHPSSCKTRVSTMPEAIMHAGGGGDGKGGDGNGGGGGGDGGGSGGGGGENTQSATQLSNAP